MKPNSNVTGFYFFSFASSLFTSSLCAANALAFPKCGESLGRINVIFVLSVCSYGLDGTLAAYRVV